MSEISNLLLNGSFETAGGGGADVFANWVETAGSGSIARDGTTWHSGAYSCRMLNNAMVHQDVTTAAGQHVFRVWSGAQGPYNVTITDLTHSTVLLDRDVYPYVSDWKLLTESVNVPAGCVSVRVALTGNITGGLSSCLDDVEFYKLNVAQTYLVSFDWNRDGVFEDEEGDRLLAARIERGRETLFGMVGQGVNRNWLGEATLELDNEDGRFDPLNPSSPLYPNILPGVWVIVQGILSDDTTVYLFKGQVTDVKGYGALGDRKARLTASDGWRWAANTRMSPAVSLQTGQQTYVLVDAILNGAGWSAVERNLEAAGDVMARWWMLGVVSDNGVFQSEAPKSALLDLMEAEAGTFFFAGDGRATYRARTYEYQRTAAETYTEDDIAELTVPAPWSTVRNVCRQLISPIVEVSGEQVWEHPELPLYVPTAGLTITVPVSYAGRDVALTTFITPVANTDYEANTQEDGSGTDETANVGVSVTYARPTFLTVYIWNSAGHPVYFTKCRVRASVVLDVPVTSVEEAEDGTSQTKYGERVFSLTNRWQQSATVAESIVQWYLYRGKDPYSTLTARLDGEDALKRDLFDRVHLDLSATVGVHSDYLISKVVQEIQRKRLISVTWNLEPADSRDFFLIDTDALDGTAILGY